MSYIITSESVTCGHPDKVCDQISDAVLDACLAWDPESRVACECLVTTWTVIVSGEITTNTWVNFADIARKTIKEIWYDSHEACFSADDVSVQILINSQSPDIAQWVDTGWAWDQWIMYGYATNETPNYLPAPISYAHKLSRRLEEARKTGVLDYLLPDWKTQVSVEYNDKDEVVRIDTVVISNQHKASVSNEVLKAGIKKEIIDFCLGDLIDDKTIIHINPTWKFVLGWPKGDAGLTGRKIIIDTYGWVGRHWGGAFSGKDPSKVDRSWAYIARYLAKNIVASGICDKTEIQLGYAIWVVQPVSININCFGTEKVDTKEIAKVVANNFDLSQNWIINKLDLKRPIFQKTASGWHFGRGDVSWEELDSVELFKELLK